MLVLHLSRRLGQLILPVRAAMRELSLAGGFLVDLLRLLPIRVGFQEVACRHFLLIDDREPQHAVALV